MALAIGTTLHNRYRIAKLVGQGGFGVVYRGWDLTLGRPVAVKENFYSTAAAQGQFEREARLLANLRHPNLPVVFDHFVLPGQGQYLVMEFIEGQSLGAMVIERGRPLDEAEALAWVRQVCTALEYLHTRKPPIIHRDIKPANIIITDDGRAVLVDFGISKEYDPSKGTTAGAKAVTAGFSPPEQYGRGRTDPRSDVYALGATLYATLTGRVPPEAPDLSSGADVLSPPRTLNPAVSEATSQAVMAAMTLSISQRLGSVSQLKQALAADSPAPPPLPPGGPQPLPATLPVVGRAAPSPAPRRPAVPMWGWLAGAAVLVALALWAIIALRDPNGGAADASPAATLLAGVATEATPQPSATPPANSTAPATPQPSATPAPTQPPSPSPPTSTPSPTQPPTSTPAAEPQLGDVRLVSRGGVAVEQVFVPAGSFLMGSEEGEPRERPVHEVTLDAFWLDRGEVTNAQFAAFVADTGYETTAEREGGAWNAAGEAWAYIDGANWQHPQGPDSDLTGLEAQPVILLTWDDAMAYADWAGGRLPTEAEWEYAARGPEGRAYPWGAAFDGQRLNFCDLNCPFPGADPAVDDGFAFLAPAGSYPAGASWVGALDMAGNLWEWLGDWFNPGYYASSPADNPTGPASGEQRGVRGGSWLRTDQHARSAFRNFNDPNFRNDQVGLRVVSPAEPGS